MKTRVLDKLRFKQTVKAGKLAAVYVRVSQDELIKTANGVDERASVGDQRDRGIAYCKKQDWDYKVYDQDCDISGTKGEEERPGIKSLVQDIRAGKIHTVIARESKRIYRNQHQLSIFVHEILYPAGCNLITLDEQTDIATGEGQLILSIKGWQSQQEVVYSAEKSIASKNRLAEQGKLRMMPPYGYGIIEEDGIRRCVIKEKEAAVVRLMFKMLIAGNGVIKIHHHLLDSGINSKRGKVITAVNIRYILSNPFYYGQMRYGGKVYLSTYPPIIDEATFQTAQVELKKRTRGGVTRGEKHLLSGILKCGYCGKGYLSTVNDRYRCATYVKDRRQACPASPPFKGFVIDDFIASLIKGLTEMDYAATLATSVIDKEDLNKKLGDLKKSLKRLHDRQKESVNLFASAQIDQASFLEIQRISKTKILEVTSSIEATQSRLNNKGIKEVEDGIKEAGKWDKLTTDGKRKALIKIISTIKAFKDKIEIYFTELPEPMVVPLTLETKHHRLIPTFHISDQDESPNLHILFLTLSKLAKTLPDGKPFMVSPL